MLKMSLKYRIAATIFAMEAIMIAVMLWTTLSRSYEAGFAKQEAHNEAVVRPIMELGRIALLNEEYIDLQTYISFIPKADGALYVLVTDVYGKIVASSNISDLGKPMPELKNVGELYWRVHDINNDSGRVGMVAVKFSDASLVAGYVKALILSVSIALCGMTFIAVVGVMMGQLLTWRLDMLAKTADQIANGNWEYTANITGSDEIAKVGQAFTHMKSMLKQHIQEIEEAKDRYHLAVSGTNDGIWDWDVEKGQGYYSPMFKSILGFAEGDPDFTSSIECWKNLVHPEDYPAVLQTLLDYLEGNSDCFVSEHRLRKKSGEYIWADTRQIVSQ